MGLLDERERDEMEQLVVKKVEKMGIRVLAWDPDEYTAAFHEKLREGYKSGE